MINYDTIEINRGVMHHIEPKTANDEHATVAYEKTEFDITEALKKVIRERLVSAAGRDSRAFELEIANAAKNSFFDHVKELKNLDKAEFYKASRKIVSLLSKCQTRNNIPGGAFILLDCSYGKAKHGLYVAIKAELHEALTHRKTAGQSKLEVLKEIFLSPAQRLYKVGIVYERVDKGNQFPNDSFAAFLYDEQFRIEGSKPASYFYKEFLGFSVDKNAKIQTKRFYDKTQGFILKSIPTVEEKSELLNVLNTELSTNLEGTISPAEFGKKYIKDETLRELYTQNVSNNLPLSIAKDTVLIEGDLNRKKISFPNSIKISGAKEEFDKSVKIITSEEEFSELTYDDENYTVITISGKPFANA